MLLDPRESDWGMITREVLRVVSDSTLLLRDTKELAPRRSISSKSLYLIGKYLNLQEYGKSIMDKDNVLEMEEVSHINTGTSFLSGGENSYNNKIFRIQWCFSEAWRECMRLRSSQVQASTFQAQSPG